MAKVMEFFCQFTITSHDSLSFKKHRAKLYPLSYVTYVKSFSGHGIG